MDCYCKLLIPILNICLIILLVTKLQEVLKNDRLFRQRNYLKALNYLADQIPFEVIHNDTDFNEFANVLKAMPEAPFVIMYDSSNVDVVLNHICNIQFVPNTLSRLVALAFDKEAQTALKEKHPNILNGLVDLKKFSTVPENHGYVTYSLALHTHAKICASLALRGIDFWSMHPDTIWTQNFTQLNVEQMYPDANLIFDTIGNDTPYYMRMKNWICGATFYVRGNPTTYQFFRQTESFMLSFQSPDSTVMAYLCGHSRYKCSFLPHTIASNYNYFEGPRENVPALVQLDAGKLEGESKMDLLKRVNFVFRFENGTCNPEAFQNAGGNVKNAFADIPRRDTRFEPESMKRKYFLKHIFNIDPLDKKMFLTSHYTLI